MSDHRPSTGDIPNFSLDVHHYYYYYYYYYCRYSSRTSLYLGEILYSGFKLATAVSLRVIIVIVQRSNVRTDTASLNMSSVTISLFPTQGYDIFFFSMPLAAQSRAMASPFLRFFDITHNDTPQSVGLPWTSDQPVADTST